MSLLLDRLPEDVLSAIFVRVFAQSRAQSMHLLARSALGCMPAQPSPSTPTSIHAFAGPSLCRALQRAIGPLLYHTIDIRGPHAERSWKRFVRALTLSGRSRSTSKQSTALSNARHVRHLVLRDMADIIAVTGFGRIVRLLTGLRSCTLLTIRNGNHNSKSGDGLRYLQQSIYDAPGYDMNQNQAMCGSLWQEFGDDLRRSCVNLQAVMINFASMSDFMSIIKNVPKLSCLVLDMCSVNAAAFDLLLQTQRQLSNQHDSISTFKGRLRELCISFPTPVLEQREIAVLLSTIAQFTLLEALQIELPYPISVDSTTTENTTTLNSQSIIELDHFTSPITDISIFSDPSITTATTTLTQCVNAAWTTLCRALPKLHYLIINANVSVKALYELQLSSPHLTLLSLNIDKITNESINMHTNQPQSSLSPYHELQRLWILMPQLRVLAFTIDRNRLAPEAFISTVIGKSLLPQRPRTPLPFIIDDFNNWPMRDDGLPHSLQAIAVHHLFAVTDHVYDTMQQDLKRMYPERQLLFLKRKAFSVYELSQSLPPLLQSHRSQMQS